MVWCRKIFFLVLLNFIAQIEISAGRSTTNSDILNIKKNRISIDSIFKSLSIDQKIAQMIWVAAYPNKDSYHYDDLTDIVKNYQLGGVIFFQGGPKQLANLSNKLQKVSKIPLLTGIDGEWGLAMRLDSTISYPKAMTLGAISDNCLVYEMGRDIALQCKRLKLASNFSPTADINSNPMNPVIGIRSFGDNTIRVFERSQAYMYGLQTEGLIATAKHFPGHGNTFTDSHLALPIVDRDSMQLDTLELMPFKMLINHGLNGIMVGHMNIPALESSNKPSSISTRIVYQKLRQNMGFKGLVFTDALNMKGVANYSTADTVAIEAIKAGNDILLMPDDIPCLLWGVKNAIDSGSLDLAIVDSACMRILRVKYNMPMLENPLIDTCNLIDDLNNPQYNVLQRKIYENAITLAKDEKAYLPLKRLDTLKIASLVIGTTSPTRFQDYLSLYTSVDHFNIDRSVPLAIADSIFKRLRSYNLIIMGIQNTDIRFVRNYGITQNSISFTKMLCDSFNVVLNIFASPYSLRYFDTIQSLKTIVMSYEDKDATQEISAQQIFGGIAFRGKLPVTVDSAMIFGKGLTSETFRNKYTLPEELKIDSKKLKQVDSIVIHALSQKAMPGCQVYAAKNGKVFYNRSFGYHTYDTSFRVKNTDVYDLASLTKILATTASILKLSDINEIKIEKHLAHYLPELQKTDKKDITIKEFLLHQTGMKDWISFYKKTLLSKDSIYSKCYSDTYKSQVADSMFIRNDYIDSIYHYIENSELNSEKTYKYSDLGFILLGKSIASVSGKNLDQFCSENFYRIIGANTLTFNPIKSISNKRIVPSERDTTFRRQLVHGYVHDPACAMLGGVCGHAGLFGNANDVGKMMQLFLQQGKYGDVQFFSDKTFEYFNTAHLKENGNRRGLGFDKPQTDTTKASPVGSEMSVESFGHSGFTGTFTWADPKTGLVYVFLSNRVYPFTENNKLSQLNVRTEILKIFQNIIVESDTTYTNDY